MRILASGAILGLTVAAALIGATPSASAAHVAISIDPGTIAFGYSDGYWDRAHQWHPWARPADAAWYRAHYRSHYFAHHHDRDREGGWRHEWWH